MATAAALNCVSRTSVSYNGVAIPNNRRELKSTALRVGKTQMTINEGLRIVYNARMIRANRNQQLKSRKFIVCGLGMNSIFVAAEVGPWSKTGGLGDAVGGLPPAMASTFMAPEGKGPLSPNLSGMEQGQAWVTGIPFILAILTIARLQGSEKAVVARHEAGHAVVDTTVSKLHGEQPRREGAILLAALAGLQAHVMTHPLQVITNYGTLTIKPFFC